MAAASKIKAEIDSGLEDLGKFGDRAFRQEARHSIKAADQQSQNDGPDLPAGKVEHVRAQSFAGLAVVGSTTSLSIDLTALTFMFGPSSTST